MSAAHTRRLCLKQAGLICATAMPTAVLLLSACSHLPPPGLIPPELEVSEIQLGEIGLSVVRFSINLAVHNKNEVLIPLSKLALNVDILDVPFASGQAREDYFELLAQSKRNVPIELAVPTARLRDLARRLAARDTSELTYRIKGSANWGRDGVLLPFERTGELKPLRRLLQLLRTN